MRLRKKGHSFWSVFAILMIIFPYLLSVASAFSQKVEAVTTGEVIFDQENLGRVEVSYQEKETTIEWQIDYQKHHDTSSDDDNQRLMKLKVDKVTSGIGTLANVNESGMAMQADGWLAESDYSPASAGKIILEVPKEENTLAVEIQLDERREMREEMVAEGETSGDAERIEMVSQETKEIQTKDILPTEMQGPFQVTAEVQMTEETQATDEEKEKEDEPKNINEEIAALPRRMTQNTGGSGTSTPVNATKRAQLATKDADGNPLSPLEAWNQRLYEISFDLTAEAPLLHGAADIVFIMDGSSSASGGTRYADVQSAITYLEEELKGTGMTVNIAILPATGKFVPDNNTQKIKLDFAPLEEWVKPANGKTLFEDQIDKINKDNYGGNKEAITANKYINEELLPGRSNQAFVIYTVGTTINDPDTVGGYVEGAANLSPENTFVAQTEGVDNDWVRYGVTQSANYFHSNNVSGDIVEAMIDALISKMVINDLELVDELSEYFEFVSIPESEEDGPKFSKDGGKFTVTDIELISSEPDEDENVHYSWSTTILVKAKDEFIGADVVPTNEGSDSGLKLPGEATIQNFDIVDGKGDTYDINTPYVDVKLLKPITLKTDETILLNQAAKDIDEITSDWCKDGSIWSSDCDAMGIDPTHEVTKDFHKDYERYPREDKTYTADHTITAGTGGEGAAIDYVANYGTKELDIENLESDAYPRSNQHVRPVIHNVNVLTTKLTIDKTLDGSALPKGFTPSFRLELVETEEPIENVEYDKKVTVPEDLIFTDLGVGTYELSEQLEGLDGIKSAGPWTVVITEKAKQHPEDPPMFEIVIDNATELTDPFIFKLNNETKGLAIDVLKLDEHTKKPISGVEFAIKDSTGDSIASGSTDATGKLRFESNPLLKVNETYTLTETSAPKDYVILSKEILFTIDLNGKIHVTEGAGEYTSVSDNKSEDTNNLLFEITVFNKPKGLLPATGGPGRRVFMLTALILLLCAMGISVYYGYRNRKGAK
ncbi:prealbumin-like fold domain-containing protein [Enterococcus dongliensis]|uniref:prealbumin-like fold domain-containing protein n=1 Tax=Enterococcus dongliensis TaxID=2559925 RepID=UPI00288F9E36|nr:prealbumin-like fold domain-containing protein [Enterococcus dongliensis]MDT2639182.1 prealbumin-like fold domain-containing protein [Enterococcus dongliensis]